MNRWIVLGAALAALSCSSSTKSVRQEVDAASILGKGIQRPIELVGGVPADAGLVVIVQSPIPLHELVGLFLDDPAARAMQEELAAFLRARTGLDLSRVDSFTLYVSASERDGAMIVRGAGGTLQGRTIGEHLGHELFSLALGDDEEDAMVGVIRDGVLVAGTDRGVRASLDTLSGRTSGLAKGNPKLAALIERDGAGAVIVVAGVLAPLVGADVAQQYRIDLGSFAIGSKGFRASVSGDPEGLERFAAAIRTELRDYAEQTDSMKDYATREEGSLLEGLGAIVLSHHAREWVRTLEPKVQGDLLSMEMGASSVPMLLASATTGALAAVAIPASLKNRKKSKTVEAKINVKKLYEGARVYYQDESPRSGKPQFPVGDLGPTPPLGTCCGAPGRKCGPNPLFWTDPVWQALRFSVDDPHYYSYTYKSDGAEFSAAAHGDLDCDGVYSTFEIVGSIQPDGTVTGQAGFFVDQDLE